MSTLVCFHAHPDDEAISTGGTMARAHAEGHRVVLVVATNGDHGEVPDDLLPGETLIERRRAETLASAAVLGIDRVAWLGYADSGMTGWEQNADAGSFHRADVDEAAGRLADVLRAESADVLTVYDWHGTYGHPDHVKVHHVGVRAAELVAGELPGLRVFEATANRDEVIATMAAAADAAAAEGLDLPFDDFDPSGPMDDGNPFGTPAAELTHAVDVSQWIDHKRRSIACHASQVTDSSFFLQMPADAFAVAFGTEYFVERGAEPGLRPGWLLD